MSSNASTLKAQLTLKRKSRPNSISSIARLTRKYRYVRADKERRLLRNRESVLSKLTRNAFKRNSGKSLILLPEDEDGGQSADDEEEIDELPHDSPPTHVTPTDCDVDLLLSDEDAQWHLSTTSRNELNLSSGKGRRCVRLDDEDSESHLIALMQASSTICVRQDPTRSDNTVVGIATNLTHSKREAKKSLLAKHAASTYRLLQSEIGDLNRLTKPNANYEQTIVDHILNRLQQSLTASKYMQVLQELADKKTDDMEGVSSLKIGRLLQRLQPTIGNSDLFDELLLLLNVDEAFQLGRQFDFFYWKKFQLFAHKLLHHFQPDLSAFNRLLKNLKQLKHNECELDKKRLKTLMNRHLNGHPYLMSEFYALFLDESPAEYLCNDQTAFDHLVLTDSPSKQEANLATLANEPHELIEIQLEALDQKYGTDQCPCRLCHHLQVVTKADDNDGRLAANLEPTTNHCIACSLKFINGKPFAVHKNRKLQPVLVDFLVQSPSSESVNTSGN
jgi:hypothetical protein